MGTIEAADAIAQALLLREDGCLMRHELAYILGQMGHVEFCETLCNILKDENDDVMVRHESAESLGAIADPSCLPLLELYCHDKLPEISETCQIAVDLIKWKQSQSLISQSSEENIENIPKSNYLSKDPAPALSTNNSIHELQTILLDSSLSLFLRYRAMFSLRNLNSDESALALVQGFNDNSALFRHEIAYVLGQMERPVTIPGLKRVLENKNEHKMVRHEAAEALGGIGGDEVKVILYEYEHDDESVVKDSCEVALGAIEYWSD
eukprot:CAMPEP_0182416866 /NCGR_PEP_ID=MMETSP1167-20130531/1246_1 /TAXON_ID=2988 /ORGANISM="Mallomonas Sp, Strain CCMP3275" /LENGTH=265 /DNA_ID=CAMNT_0024589995 /DNA_START=244 /DNA_END=1038 /DNA_ORIENTATION=-